MAYYKSNDRDDKFIHLYDKKIDSTNIYNLKGAVAKRAETSLWGNGYEVIKLSGSDEDKKKFEDLLNDLNLIGVACEMERSLSENGRKGLLVDFDANLNFRITLFNDDSLYYTDNSGKVVGAVTYRKTYYGTEKGHQLARVHEVWSNGDVKKTISLMNLSYDGKMYDMPFFADNKFRETEVNDWNWMVKDDSGMPLTPNQQLPIILFQNLNSVGNDSDPDDKNVQHIQPLVNHLISTMVKDAEISRARYGIDRDDKQLLSDIQRKGLFGAVNDGWFAKDSSGGQDKDTKSVELLANEFRTEGYVEALKEYERIYFESCGYSSIQDSQASQTVIGTLFSSRLDTETTRKKLKIRTYQYNQLFALIIHMMKYRGMIDKDFDANIKIKTNILYDEQSKIDFVNTLQSLGIGTTEDYVKIMYNIDNEDDLQEKVKSIEKEQEKQLEMAQAQQPEPEDNTEDTNKDV